MPTINKSNTINSVVYTNSNALGTVPITKHSSTQGLDELEKPDKKDDKTNDPDLLSLIASTNFDEIISLQSQIQKNTNYSFLPTLSQGENTVVGLQNYQHLVTTNNQPTQSLQTFVQGNNNNMFLQQPYYTYPQISQQQQQINCTNTQTKTQQPAYFSYNQQAQTLQTTTQPIYSTHYQQTINPQSRYNTFNTRNAFIKQPIYTNASYVQNEFCKQNSGNYYHQKTASQQNPYYYCYNQTPLQKASDTANSFLVQNNPQEYSNIQIQQIGNQLGNFIANAFTNNFSQPMDHASVGHVLNPYICKQQTTQKKYLPTFTNTLASDQKTKDTFDVSNSTFSKQQKLLQHSDNQVNTHNRVLTIPISTKIDSNQLLQLREKVWYQEQLLNLNRSLIHLNAQKEAQIKKLETYIRSQINSSNSDTNTEKQKVTTNSTNTTQTICPSISQQSNRYQFTINKTSINQQTNSNQKQQNTYDQEITKQTLGKRKYEYVCEYQKGMNLRQINTNIEDYVTVPTKKQKLQAPEVIVIDDDNQDNTSQQQHQKDSRTQKCQFNEHYFFTSERVPQAIYSKRKQFGINISKINLKLSEYAYNLLCLPTSLIPVSYQDLMNKISFLKNLQCQVIPCFLNLESQEHNSGRYQKSMNYIFSSFIETFKDVFIFTPEWFDEKYNFLMADKDKIHVCFYALGNASISEHTNTHHFVYNIEIDSELNQLLLPKNHKDQYIEDYRKKLKTAKTTCDYYQLFITKVIERASNAMQILFNKIYLSSD